MRIAYISEGSPLDINTWSGTPCHIAVAPSGEILSQHDFSVPGMTLFWLTGYARHT